MACSPLILKDGYIDGVQVYITHAFDAGGILETIMHELEETIHAATAGIVQAPGSFAKLCSQVFHDLLHTALEIGCDALLTFLLFRRGSESDNDSTLWSFLWKLPVTDGAEAETFGCLIRHALSIATEERRRVRHAAEHTRQQRVVHSLFRVVLDTDDIARRTVYKDCTATALCKVLTAYAQSPRCTMCVDAIATNDPLLIRLVLKRAHEGHMDAGQLVFPLIARLGWLPALPLSTDSGDDDDFMSRATSTSDVKFWERVVSTSAFCAYALRAGITNQGVQTRQLAAVWHAMVPASRDAFIHALPLHVNGEHGCGMLVLAKALARLSAAVWAKPLPMRVARTKPVGPVPAHTSPFIYTALIRLLRYYAETTTTAIARSGTRAILDRLQCFFPTVTAIQAFLVHDGADEALLLTRPPHARQSWLLDLLASHVNIIRKTSFDSRDSRALVGWLVRSYDLEACVDDDILDCCGPASPVSDDYASESWSDDTATDDSSEDDFIYMPPAKAIRTTKK